MRSKITRIIFWVAMALGTVAQLATLPYSPAHCTDEVQVHEVSRHIYEATDWSMRWTPNWNDLAGFSSINDVGLMFQEPAYKLLGHIGPRMFSLLCLSLMALLVRYYLQKKTKSDLVSVSASLLCFTYPLLVQSVHNARVESLVFLLLFASLAVLQMEYAKTHCRITLILSGVLASLCALSWATSPILLPIVAWEWIAFACSRDEAMSKRVSLLVYPVVSAFITIVVLFVPVMFNDINASISQERAMIAAHLPVDSLGFSYLDSFRIFLKEISVFPCTLIVGVLCLFLRRRFWPMWIGVIAFSAVCIFTYCYCFRVVYFLPYAIIALTMLASSTSGAKRHNAFIIVLILMAVASYFRSVILRNGIEIFACDIRNESLLESSLEDSIGRDKTVYSATFHVYYAGRALGWKQYAKFHKFGVIMKDIPTNVLAKCEYLIVHKPDETEKCREEYARAGFELYDTIPAQDTILPFAKNLLKMVNHLGPYGPYDVYRNVTLTNK